MIVLLGFMAAGKSTVGRLLAARLGLPFVDTDALIEERAGMSVADIFAAKGEEGFREIERAVVMEELNGRRSVVSLGGGAVADPVVRRVLQQRDTVWLDVSLDEALRRIGSLHDSRPMLSQSDNETLHAERTSLYESVADVRIDTIGRTPSEVADELTQRFAREPDGGGGATRVRVDLEERGYDVVVGDGIASATAGFVPGPLHAEKAFVVTHPELDELTAPVAASLEGAGLEVITLHIPEGEAAKSLDSAESLFGALAKHRAHRHDLVVAVGGGVVTDVGGFVASTYVRGMPLVHVPTTLLGMVDAAIGGKTGVNLPDAKNLVGTIYQPHCVVCDVSFLKTCPPEEIRSGMAEVVKYGFISDPSLLQLVLDKSGAIEALDPPTLVDLVRRCAAIKASIVASDEREVGERAFLNYGHTFAHAIEATAGYATIRHGEAVAIGMMAAVLTAAELGRLDEDAVDLHRRVLRAVGLPTSAELDLATLATAWEQDKKYFKGVRFVLLSAIGEPEAGIEVPEAVLERALQRLAREDGHR